MSREDVVSDVSLQLGARLAAVAAWVPPGRPMADIGTDHGRLPAFLVASGQVPYALGVDDKAAPLAGARALAARLGLGPALELRLGSGCSAIETADAIETVTVAGMGGSRMVQILSLARAVGANRLVLQPNEGEEVLRHWLDDNGWEIDGEQLVLERGRRFVVLMAGPGPGRGLDGVDCAYGQAAAHVAPAALLARLTADEQRLSALVGRHGSSAAVQHQLDAVRTAQGRIPTG